MHEVSFLISHASAVTCSISAFACLSLPYSISFSNPGFPSFCNKMEEADAEIS
jgi:hypothetical protein